MTLFKYIGLGILGLGGVSSVAALSSSRVRGFIGLSSESQQSSLSTPSPTDPSTLSYIPDIDSSSLSEEDRKWQFLYEFSKKFFYSLKSNSKSSLNKNPKSNVIEWLKDKFKGSLDNEDDKWENFKSLCEDQKNKETQSGKNINIHEARLCFLDNDKGNLKEWHNEAYDGAEISSTFFDWNKKNIELWNLFNSKYPNANPIDKFDEWYDSESDLENIKKAIKLDTSNYAESVRTSKRFIAS